MLAFPLCTLPGFSLSEQAVLAPALDVFAVLSTVNVSSASVRLVLFACACSWAGVYGALACTVCHSYTKSQFANSLPVKVRRRLRLLMQGVGLIFKSGEGNKIQTPACAASLA